MLFPLREEIERKKQAYMAELRFDEILSQKDDSDKEKDEKR